MRVDEGSGQLRTKLHSQRVPGGVHRLPHCSAEELATGAARKGDRADSGAMLCAPLKLGDGVIGVGGVVGGQVQPLRCVRHGAGTQRAASTRADGSVAARADQRSRATPQTSAGAANAPHRLVSAPAEICNRARTDLSSSHPESLWCRVE
jgi:hypothetical protein